MGRDIRLNIEEENVFSRDEIGDITIFENEYGMVFSGGGAKGAYQAGAIKALYECGLLSRVTFAAGSSIGAINMCLLSQDNPSDGIELWDSVRLLDIIDIDVKLIDGKEGFSNREGLVNIINNNIDLEKIIKGKINCYATLSEFDGDMTTPKAKYIHLNEYEPEKIIEILLASSALPIVYEPVHIDGITYKDGGITDNLPIKPLYDRGVRKFIIVSLSHTKQVPVEKYKDAEFIIIRPSISLGDLVDGTLNFSKVDIKKREKLGYYDTVRTLKYYNTPVSKTIDFDEFIKENAKNDLSIINTEMICEKEQNNFEGKKNKINAIMEKYGIKE
jgi:NTE family protein